MPGLRTLEQQRQDACRETKELVDKLRTARDPERAKALAADAARRLDDAVESVRIIDAEKGWAELDRLNSPADVC